MTRVNFGAAIGKTLKAKAYQEDGTYRESDITLSDMTGKGLYLGASSSDLTPGDDVLIYDVATSDIGPIGFGEYDYNTNKVISDIVVADVVIDKIYSDTTIIASDLIVADAIADKIYSDTTILVSDTIFVDTLIDNVYSDTTIIASDVQVAISDLDLIYTAVRTTTHEYHLDEE